MRKYGIMIIAALAAMLWSCSNSTTAIEEEDYLMYVDPKIGSGDHGHVFVGASVPYGMVQVGPTSVPQQWDWCSGYHESDSTVIGFSHTHLSGTGIGDLFDVTLMPIVGTPTFSRGTTDDPESGLWSYAERSKEIAEPGYYRVPLTRYGIDAEMTASTRAGMHRYTFPTTDDAAIVIDLENGGCWDHAVDTKLTAVSPTRIEGYRFSSGWAKDQKAYFVAEFSKPMKNFSIENEHYGVARFDTDASEPVLVKVGISPVSIEGASANLKAEIPDWDFDKVKAEAQDSWRKELSKIKISTPDADVKKKFYTALYHTMIFPATFSDVDGMYRGADGNVYKAEGFTPYTVLSLWDTYRAAMPLMGIWQPKRYADLVNGMIDICDKQGRLPVWHLWGNETDCMVGNPGVIVVADAIANGTEGIDRQKALNAMLVTVADTARGLGFRAEYGFIPADLESEAIAKDMEYAIADAAIANAARSMGETAIADSFAIRSHSYRNYFDPSTTFIRGKLKDGSWRTPFDPFSAEHRADDYCEGNAWQYTWLVPHDLDGLIECFGSKDKLVAKFDSLFTIESKLTGDASPDISGLIGQYAHGNEPSHHVLYLYAMLGQPEKGNKLIRKVLDEMYTTNPAGLCGNEDAGQMSAWYIMSALGFYETEPAMGRYWLGSPIIDNAEIDVPGGKFTIEVKRKTPQALNITKAYLDGKPYDKPYILHSDIMRGAHLTLEME